MLSGLNKDRAAILWLHLCVYSRHGQNVDRVLYVLQVLVCAPSNVAVDQLAEKISATGLKVLDSMF